MCTLEPINNQSFETMLTGGHPNSLGRTVEVVDVVLADGARLHELYNCYFSTDPVVRLRTSSALKRISQTKPEWLIPYIDRLLQEISDIDQASTQWTLAILFRTLAVYMNQTQHEQAMMILKRNLATHKDWIVLNMTMETLVEWAQKDEALKGWLLPHLDRLYKDKRKSVSARAKKFRAVLT